jgi:hypothetical protein
MSRTRFFVAFAALRLTTPLFAQATSDQGTPPQTAAEPQEKRLFGIIPNYRTSPFPNPYQPLTAAEKFKLASQDALDRGTSRLLLCTPQKVWSSDQVHHSAKNLEATRAISLHHMRIGLVGTS